jgi:hypothetical protein
MRPGLYLDAVPLYKPKNVQNKIGSGDEDDDDDAYEQKQRAVKLKQTGKILLDTQLKDDFLIFAFRFVASLLQNSTDGSRMFSEKYQKRALLQILGEWFHCHRTVVYRREDRKENWRLKRLHWCHQIGLDPSFRKLR